MSDQKNKNVKISKTKTLPHVGVSQCLLGDAVRYDGQSKSNTIVLERFSDIFNLVPICPEVEAGFGVPRPPVELTGNINKPRLTGRDDTSLDVTTTMTTYCQNKPAELKHLVGFIFKSRSPSCGLNTTPVFLNKKCLSETSRGIFARAITSQMPELPVIEESAFCEESIADFIQQVFDLHLATP